MVSPEDAERIVAEYEAARPRFTQFTDALVGLLRTLLAAVGAEYVSAVGRTKDIESFRDKITREGKNYGNPMTEITDFCGARIVCYDIASVQKIGKMITENFAVDPQNSVDKAQQLDPDQFGYLSVHYVVQLDNRRRTLPEYVAFEGMKAEIQVRTALQHAWASLDHTLRYKSKHDVPSEIRRPLYRISALLELADDEFLRLKSKSDTLRSTYAADVTASRLDAVEVNADSIDAFIDKNAHHLETLNGLAQKAGFALMPFPPGLKTPWSNLIRTLESADLHTLRQLEDALVRVTPKVPQVFASLALRWKAETASPRLVLDPSTLLRLAILFSLPSDKALEVMKVVRFGPSLQKVMVRELEPPAPAGNQ